MARPSGTCNGQPCYTTADVAEINAELANEQVEKDDNEASLAVAQQEVQEAQAEVNSLNAAIQQNNQKISALTYERDNSAVMWACPQ